MKDIDFDELDKAVNSLMAGVPKNQAQTDPVEKTVDIPTTDTTVPVSIATHNLSGVGPASQSVKSTESTTASVTAPASRRGGRFMDVVHPSSSMKKPEPPRRVSRQGATIAPRPAAESAPSSTPSLTPSAPEPVTTPPASATPPADVTPPKNDWPDPLEMAGFDTEKDTDVPTPSRSAEETAKPEITEAPEPEQTAEPPLTSPFLPDTKVEKRPLGGKMNEEPKAEVDNDLPAIVNDEQLPAKPDDVKPVLPEELHSDLVAIESDTTGEKEDEKKPDEAIPPPEFQSLPPAKPVSEEKPKETMPVGPASIPQQYREEPSSGDQKNGAIYDTASYHQPLAHPAKQKSGWMWVVWILLILIIGAGGGAALYFFRLV